MVVLLGDDDDEMISYRESHFTEKIDVCAYTQKYV